MGSLKTCQIPSKIGGHKKHSKIKMISFKNIFMRLEGSVNMTSVQVIVKFGYDQRNIFYWTALFKKMLNPSKLCLRC